MKKNRVAVRRSVKRAGGLAGISTTLWMSTAALAGGTTLLYAGVQMPDSLVAKWVVRPLATISVATVDSSGGLPTTVGETTTTTKTAAPTTVKPTKLGINLMEADFSASNRPFANLMLSSYIWLKSAAGDPEASYFDSNGNLIKLNAGDNIQVALPRPNAVYQGKSVDIVCTWTGKATLQVSNNGAAVNGVVRANEARFTYVNTAAIALLKILTVDPTNPFGNLDCREAGSDPTKTFDPAYASFLSRFNTIRFMDWQEMNKNRTVTWATRSRLVGKNFIRGKDGYPIELMIKLANETHTNPWFCMPWNADDDYIRKFAELVRDTLDPTLVAHVETANEVWNWYFLVGQQASTEGLAEGLSTDKGYAQVYRYAERTGQVMDIWSSVFAGKMSRIVRVAAWQAANPDGFNYIMGFRTTASKVDALASAPYLDYNLDTNPVTLADLSPVFTQMKSRIDMHVINQGKIRTIAAKYGKRVIAYEGGQHVTGQASDINSAIQKDTRMGDIYTQFLRSWQQNSGDLMVLYADTAAINKYGAWGLTENAGQAPDSTVKGKSVQLFQAAISK
ncbi:MAG: hypothetical protein J7494_01405 [Sphingobium sp.]|nr:hypothetical protein [Sphingobium sp.]